MGRRLFFLLLLFVLGAAHGGEQRYGASLDEVSWSVSVSRLECTLSQDIPLYGTATFKQHAGGDLGFTLKVKRRAPRDGVARLRSVPPPWKRGAAVLDLGEVAVARGDTPFGFRPVLSHRLLHELENGMSPTLNFPDWADGRDDVTVVLSPVNIRTPLDEFLSCLAALLPYDFKDVERSRILFPFGKQTLTARARARLDKVAAYLDADGTVGKVTIEGHTDNKGMRRYNDRLGKLRAEAVRDYLVAKGAPADKFNLSSRGERRPAHRNRTEKGRRLNRRAIVILVK